MAVIESVLLHTITWWRPTCCSAAAAAVAVYASWLLPSLSVSSQPPYCQEASWGHHDMEGVANHDGSSSLH